VFKKINIALSPEVRDLAQSSEAFRGSALFRNAVLLATEWMNLGVLGGHFTDPWSLRIGSTSAQGQEFIEKVFLKCDRVTGYITFLPVRPTPGLHTNVISVEVAFYKGRHALGIYRFRFGQDGKFHEME
jgi:hypothetical protein